MEHLPAITRSMASSKCFSSICWCMSRAAINAASLHTLAMSAPTTQYKYCSMSSLTQHTTKSQPMVYLRSQVWVQPSFSTGHPCPTSSSVTSSVPWILMPWHTTAAYQVSIKHWTTSKSLHICNSNSHLPLMSGSGTKICRSNLPGLSKAGSRISTLFVAASTTTFVCCVKPAKVTFINNILVVCKNSLLMF